MTGSFDLQLHLGIPNGTKHIEKNMVSGSGIL